MNQTVSLEVCSNSVTSAVAAQEGGAIRVELCENLPEGGTTPSFGQLLLARKLLHIQVFVLIRPRSGDFLYSDLEFEVIKADVRNCIEAGADGIVIGILNADGTIDKPRCKELVDMAKAYGLGVTFHRAFDMCKDIYQSLEDVIELGCDRILTSGGKSTAMEGASVLNHLVEKAAGRIAIMPGSGVNAHNVADLVRFTGVTEVHSSARTSVKSKMEYHNDHILLNNNLTDEDTLYFTDAEVVKGIIAAANS
ncbi:copper homeostasis protein CutC [Mucilaginibacter pedocola]|uniref:PF03932 family protein CutC n=2 Tax=Mucilaginibacter pedocola TaxID=1792845 RepID=A0A1S9PJ31_9SPHI|nr:copper homeostasis protein CutC [Mucilaginibacter pedocola]